MPIRLQVAAGAASADGSKPPPQELKLDGDLVTIGRDKSATVVLQEQSVSRTHATISREGSLYFLEDAGSAFGTRVNGQVLPKGEKRLLRNGDVIAVGTFDLTFTRVLEVTSPEGREGAEKTSMLARAVMKDVMRGLSSNDGPHLIVLNGPHKDDKHEVGEAQELTVGRSDECNIVFADDLTSRVHAKFRRDWSGTHVEDLGSRNGVKVNKKSIKGPTTLKDRDEVEIGGTRMLYVDPSEIREAPFVPPQTDPGLMPAVEDKLPPRVPRKGKGNNLETKPQEAPEPPVQAPAEPASDLAAPEPEPLSDLAASEPASDMALEAGSDMGAAEPPSDMGAEPPSDLGYEPGSDMGVGPGGARRLPVQIDAQQIKRFLPFIIVGVVGLIGIGVLIAIFVAV